MAEQKRRNWLAVQKVASLPQDWEDIVDSWQVKCWCALHDSDCNKEGEVKDAHIHFVIAFDGPTTLSVVRELLGELGIPYAKPCISLVGSVRYLRHLDSPKKFLYPPESVYYFGGADSEMFDSQSESQKFRDFATLTEFIDANHITEFCTLVRLTRSYNDGGEMFRVVMRNFYAVDRYICSVRNGLVKAGTN